MRQLIIESNPDKNGVVIITGKDYRYLKQVLRVKNGDMVNLRCQNGELYGSTVSKIDEGGKKIILQVCASTGNEAEKTITRGVQADQIQQENQAVMYEYWLFQFVPKPQKFEQIVRQATECGIKYIVPVMGEYSEKSSQYAFEGAKLERLERIVKEARQQSGSPVDTKILSCMSLQEALDVWNEGKTEKIGFVLSERTEKENDIRKIIESKCNFGKIGIAVGSEGGLSVEEVEALKSDGDFFPVHFPVNILRCETAALYGIAAVQTAVN